MDHLRRQGLKDAERRFRAVTRRTFACREDASGSLDEVMKEHRGSAYDVFPDIVGMEVVERRPSAGRPPKDASSSETHT